MQSPARVAELVDAADSKSAVRKNVSVRLRSRAQTLSHKRWKGVFFCNTTIKPRQIVIIALLIEINYYLYQQAKLREQK